MLTLARLRGEAEHSAEVSSLNAKIDAVGTQNTHLANLLLGPKVDGVLTETERREAIENSLRSEFILANKPIDPKILAGKEYPPASWMNKRLKELGEAWQFQAQADYTAPTQSLRPSTMFVKGASVRLATKAGEDSEFVVQFGVNNNGPLKSFLVQSSAVRPIYPNDPSKQKELEDGLWNNVLKVKNRTPLQVPSNNQTLAFPIPYPSITEVDFDGVNVGIVQYYFMAHIFDQNGKTLLDFCARVDEKGATVYCRSHNGP